MKLKLSLLIITLVISYNAISQNYLSFNPGYTYLNFKNNDSGNPYEKWSFTTNSTFGCSFQYHFNYGTLIPTLSLDYRKYHFNKIVGCDEPVVSYTENTTTIIDFIVIRYDQEFHFIHKPDLYCKLGIFYGHSISYSVEGLYAWHDVSTPGVINSRIINDKNNKAKSIGLIVGLGWIHPINKTLGIRLNIDLASPYAYENVKYSLQPSLGIVWKLNSTLADRI